MKTFETKAQDFYGEVIINKALMSKAGFGARAIPVYVGEWIVSQFVDGDNLDEEGRRNITEIVSNYLPQKSDKQTILNRLMRQEEVMILDDYRVMVNLERNSHELGIPVLDENKAMIQKGIVDENPMLLKTGMWGLGTLRYIPPDGEEIKKGQIWMVDFKAFQSPGVDLDYYKAGRSNFDLEEWIDLLVSSCQFNPDIHSLPQKMLLLSRLIPLVEPRVNLVELAPKGTGKSFVFDNISRYAAVIPGGKLSAPALFYNKTSREIGLIPRYDVVVIDEVQKIHTDAAGEAMAGLKMYLESGRYRRATGDMGTSEAGFAMLGNISLGADRRPLYETNGILKELPPALQESAFVDRIHGMIEGWYMPRITKNTPSRHLGLKGDFLSEILHMLRSDLSYAEYVTQHLRLPQCEDMRDNKAVARIAEGLLKLLFPDLNLTRDEFVEYCVNPAVRMRQQVRDELSKLDPEYAWTTLKSEEPDEFQLNHPNVKPDPKEETQAVDPLDPDRSPSVTTFDIKEEQRGVSYVKLFAPYLKECRKVQLADPYLRYTYQLSNLIGFCECIAADTHTVSLELITAAGSLEDEVELSGKLDEIKENLEKDGVRLDYRFDPNLHDRSIVTDSGWRILLGRGLDIFQKPEGRFTLGFIDQTKRKCKETTISFLRT